MQLSVNSDAFCTSAYNTVSDYYCFLIIIIIIIYFNVIVYPKFLTCKDISFQLFLNYYGIIFVLRNFC